MAALRPVVEFMTFNFAMQAIDQIINSAAKTLYMSGGQMGCPIVFRGPNGAAARVGAQHSQCYAAWYSAIPGLKVVTPYSASDAKGLLKQAIRDPNPVIFLENEILYGKSFRGAGAGGFHHSLRQGQYLSARVDDVTIVSFGIGMTYAMDAAERLADDGIEAEVINLRTLRPMDYRHDPRLGSENQSACHRRRRLGPQGAVGNYITSVVMEHAFDLAGCAGPEPDRQGRAHALRGEPRKTGIWSRPTKWSPATKVHAKSRCTASEEGRRCRQK